MPQYECIIRDHGLALWLTGNPVKPMPTDGIRMYRWIAECIAVHGEPKVIPIFWPIADGALDR